MEAEQIYSGKTLLHCPSRIKSERSKISIVLHQLFFIISIIIIIIIIIIINDLITILSIYLLENLHLSHTWWDSFRAGETHPIPEGQGTCPRYLRII